ncbi:MAG: 30S ribosomal protein S8 [Candidatus Taylorbacteria bacterium]|nr:30S ribosomal protein S8 [Candidatus Taylorbacteria bacterium]
MDPISDLIIRIKNASEAGKASIVMPYSKFKEGVATILAKEGYIKSSASKGKKINKYLEIEILYKEDKSPRINGVERVSKLSKRIYTKAKDLRPFHSGFGSIILSTPKGILTDKDAKKAKVGGEVLFKIW